MTEFGSKQQNYDAMGYRTTDGFLYAVQGSDLIRIDANGAITVVGTVPGLSGVNTGDFGDDGWLHVSVSGDQWRRINVDTLEVVAVPELSVAHDVADLVNIGGKFYGADRDGGLWVYDPTSLTVTTGGLIEGLQGSGVFHAGFTDIGDNLYVTRRTGHFFQIVGYSTGSPVAHTIATAPVMNSADGASCPMAAAPAGTPDVDGPVSELDPSYQIGDAGLGEGASCSGDPELAEDRLPRAGATGLVVAEPTVVYDNGYDGATVDYRILSGSWSTGTGDLVQNNECGYDYTALLDTPALSDYQMVATMRAADGSVNHGGIVIHQSSETTRAGAMLIDFSDGGSTLRWGEYDAAGYYQMIGALPVTTSTSVTLGLVVHGSSVEISVDGVTLHTATATNTAGYVGLVTSVASVAFEHVTVTAIPA